MLQIRARFGIPIDILIEDYDLNLDTGLGSGGITVFGVNNTDPSGASLSEFKKFVGLALQQGFGVTDGNYDPLVIDLDGDGLELSRQGERNIYFDHDGDNFAERTGWVKADDGLLAIDLNGDGVIDASDAQFDDLLVWQDINQDGISDAGELQSLTARGITSISLTGTAPATGSLADNAI